MSQASLPELTAWDRLTAPEGGRLTVLPLEHHSFEELLVVDDDLPQCGGATLFWAWPTSGGWAARAALIRDGRATPFAIKAARLRLQFPDPNLLRLLAVDPAAPPASVELVGHARHLERPPRHLACICRLTPDGDVYAAIERGWHTVDALKRATGVAFGQCQGRRCVSDLARRVDLGADDPRGAITSRPPLLPVPASILAAFAEA